MQELFPDYEEEIHHSFQLQEEREKGRYCRNCSNAGYVEYRSGKRFYYCSLITSKRTACGYKKVKALNWCVNFKED